MFLTISPEGYNTRQDLPPKSGAGGTQTIGHREGVGCAPGGGSSFPPHTSEEEARDRQTRDREIDIDRYIDRGSYRERTRDRESERERERERGREGERESGREGERERGRAGERERERERYREMYVETARLYAFTHTCTQTRRARRSACLFCYRSEQES